MLLTGVLIAQETYFAELAESSPLMSALQPATGLLGKEYAREVAAEARHHLHLRGGRAGDEEMALWRVSLEAVDAWSLRAPAGASGDDDKGAVCAIAGRVTMRPCRRVAGITSGMRAVLAGGRLWAGMVAQSAVDGPRWLSGSARPDGVTTTGTLSCIPLASRLAAGSPAMRRFLPPPS